MNLASSSYHANITTLQQVLRVKGVDEKRIIAQAGIEERSSFSETYRIPHEKMSDYIELVLRSTSPSISLTACEFFNPACYNAFGMGLLYSDTLHSFCQRFERYFALVSTSIKVKYSQLPGYKVLSFDEQVPVTQAVSNFYCDSFLGVVVKFLRLLKGNAFSPAKVKMSWQPTHQDINHYQQYFRCPIEFSSSNSAIYIKEDNCEEVLAAANNMLAMQADYAVTELLSKIGSVDLKSRVAAKITEFLPTGQCSRENVAKSLNMSTSTLHLNLKNLDTSYQELLDLKRRELALEYIGCSDFTREKTADLLGFSDCSNFSRAFKKWVGMSPCEYKLKH